MRFRSLSWVPTHLTETHFTETHFTETHFTETHFTETHFTETHFTETHFTETRLTETHFTETHFTETHFTETHFTETHFTETHFTEDSLRYVNVILPWLRQLKVVYDKKIWPIIILRSPPKFDDGKLNSSISIILAFPADIGRKPATLKRRREPALPATLTRRLIKRPTAQHGGARKES